MQDSADVRQWLSSGAGAVKRARDRLDAINVFPVADSDTGTNVYLTLQEGNRAVAKLGDDATDPRYIETELGVGYRWIAELTG